VKVTVDTQTPVLPVEADPRWQAIVSRDKSADGQFYYAVHTTGVYCRPSCGSRLARPEHVTLHATREAAERAGFRPCRRCRPDLPPEAERHAALVAEACRRLESAFEPIPLAELASRAGLSPHYFLRIFKAVTGLTPRQFAVASRADRTRVALRGARRVTDAAYDAGFGSAGRFYAAARAALGMPPRTFQRGGAGTTITYGTAPCSLGTVLAARTRHGICAVMLDDDEDALAQALKLRFPRATLVEGDPSFAQTLREIAAVVDDPTRTCRLPLDLQGTVFQRRVWQALQAIPAGKTVTYGALARRIGEPSAVRAVAAACGANPVAVIVPCHRVVGADGKLTGYRWGLARKRQLIAREARRLDGLDDPAGHGPD
jgi:AraC family transcriptional regulator of adaptative response/methylated-DNA-[protein]-cysteine methyltransferase